MDESLKYLRGISLFEECSDEALSALVAAPHRLQRFADGALIMRQGEMCLSLMLLVAGGILSRMGGEDGREVVVERHAAPQVLAPAFLFATDNTLPVEVSASGEATVLYVNREAFFSFMCQHPAVLRRFLAVVSDRTHALSAKVRGFAVTGLRGRVLQYIQHHGAITNVSEAAGMLGVARPSLSRVLTEMIDDGLLCRTPTGITLVG